MSQDRQDRGPLEALSEEVAPPEGLEDAVTNALAERGLVRPARRGGRKIRLPLALAASLVLFAAGYGLGRAVRPEAGGATAGSASAGSAAGAGAAVETDPAVHPGAEAETGAAPEAASAGSATPAGPLFLLLLYEGPDFAPDRSVGQLVTEYGAWARSLREAGVLVRAEKLAGDGAWVVRAPETSGEGVGPGSSAPSGFYLITAPDYEAAVRIARASPHVRYGGAVSVRRIDPT